MTLDMYVEFVKRFATRLVGDSHEPGACWVGSKFISSDHIKTWDESAF